MGKEIIDLLVIDPQVDFCDPKKGALYVPGAEDDMERVANLIKRVGSKIKRIHVTLDCHHYFDIAHPGFWRNSEGKNPDPFTIITNSDIVNGIWRPVFLSLPNIPNSIEYLKGYTSSLEASGRYPLCIWPPHCLIGSEGNSVLPVLYEALIEWEKVSKNNVNYVSKGSVITTEHYSAVKAEVPDPNDANTQLNTRFVKKTLMDADQIWVAGEAGSHCLKATVEDIADGFGDDSYVQKMTLITDGTSPVISPFVDFPSIQDKFISDMKLRGMKTALTTEL